MKILLISISLSLLISVLLYSCRCSCPCVVGDMVFGLIAYSDAEADTIILRRFEKNTNFSNLKDTSLIDINSLRFSRSSDTLRPSYNTGNTFLNIDYNYELYIPATQNLYRISDITLVSSNNDCGCFSKVSCVTEVKSYKLNNSIRVPEGFNFIFLHK